MRRAAKGSLAQRGLETAFMRGGGGWPGMGGREEGGGLLETFSC
jgi:hypothetical protein